MKNLLRFLKCLLPTSNTFSPEELSSGLRCFMNNFFLYKELVLILRINSLKSHIYKFSYTLITRSNSCTATLYKYSPRNICGQKPTVLKPFGFCILTRLEILYMLEQTSLYWQDLWGHLKVASAQHNYVQFNVRRPYPYIHLLLWQGLLWRCTSVFTSHYIFSCVQLVAWFISRITQSNERISMQLG